MLFFKECREIGAEESWHLDIKDEEVIMMLQGLGKPCLAIRRPVYMSSDALEDFREQLARGFVIINDKDTHSFSSLAVGPVGTGLPSSISLFL